MNTTFACPGCGASGSADASLEGRQVRCPHCGQRFPVPGPDGPDQDGYSLDQAAPMAVKTVEASPIDDRPVFVSTRSDEPVVATSRRKRKRTSSKKSRRESPEIAWGSWLLRVSIVASIVLALIGWLAPGGQEKVGWTLLGLGTLMVLIGYGAGVVGAFSEDSLYGILYLILPFYTGYYVVTRWDDLWRWFACSTAGFCLVVLGTTLLRWSGVTD
jgi:DNA-directed RNA polymerase subunit RPC12/RpoP